MIIKLSAKYSVKGLGHDRSSPSFSHNLVPFSVFANLPFNSIMVMRANSSKSLCPKAFLKVSSIYYFSRWLMALNPYESAALWTHQRLHRHAALTNCKKMTVKTGVPMTRTSKLPRRCRIYLPFLLIIN